MDFDAFNLVVAGVVTNPLVMMLLGALANLFQRLLEKSTTEPKITIAQYIKKNPYRIGISVVGMIVGYSLLITMGQLSTLNALGVGYFCHSIVETFASKFDAGKLKNTDDPK